LPGMPRRATTFNEAADEYLRYIEVDRNRKPSTIRGYRWIIHGRLRPAFGPMLLEDITTARIEEWHASLPLAPSSRRKALVLLHGIFRRARKVYGLGENPVAEVEKPPQSRNGDIEVFSPQEIWSLVRAARDEQDGAIFLTAALTGLRMGELIALRWRDVDFEAQAVRVRASYSVGHLTTPKSGRVRSVPLAPDVARAMARLGRRQSMTADDDLVFVGERSGFVDGSALRRRYKAALKRAGLRPLRFHDLRHTFGTRMIAKADIRLVQHWMGHADIQTTMKYLHYVPRGDEARLVEQAFQLEESAESGAAGEPGERADFRAA
jgi:integrase